jgi:hypothetical protein
MPASRDKGIRTVCLLVGAQDMGKWFYLHALPVSSATSQALACPQAAYSVQDTSNIHKVHKACHDINITCGNKNRLRATSFH